MGPVSQYIVCVCLAYRAYVMEPFKRLFLPRHGRTSLLNSSSCCNCDCSISTSSFFPAWKREGEKGEGPVGAAGHDAAGHDAERRKGATPQSETRRRLGRAISYLLSFAQVAHQLLALLVDHLFHGKVDRRLFIPQYTAWARPKVWA